MLLLVNASSSPVPHAFSQLLHALSQFNGFILPSQTSHLDPRRRIGLQDSPLWICWHSSGSPLSPAATQDNQRFGPNPATPESVLAITYISCGICWLTRVPVASRPRCQGENNQPAFHGEVIMIQWSASRAFSRAACVSPLLSNISSVTSSDVKMSCCAAQADEGEPEQATTETSRTSQSKHANPNGVLLAGRRNVMSFGGRSRMRCIFWVAST